MPPSLPIALTMGDPAGISGEITLLAWERLRNCKDFSSSFFLIADMHWIKSLASVVNVPVVQIQQPEEVSSIFYKALPVMDCPVYEAVIPGKMNFANAIPIIESIRTAINLIKEGKSSGLVTNPLSKAVIRNGAETTFSGHTGFIREICKQKNAFMLFVNHDLCIASSTLHIPLKEVLQQLSSDLIVETTLLTLDFMRKYLNNESPLFAISGINPHAGEGGALGIEEQTIIIPAIRTLQNKYNLNVEGPFPGDIIFTDFNRKRFDAIICMYHDQALIAPKALDFMGYVNVTAGLPIIRTSPGHGVAYELAGTWKADPRGLCNALQMAYNMSKHHN